jgi:hypothetical protein
MPACKFCGEPFTTAANVQKHQSQAPDCLRKVEEEFRNITRLRRERRAMASRPPFTACGNTDFGTDFGTTYEAEMEFSFPAGGLPQLEGRRDLLEPENEVELPFPANTNLHEPVVDWDAIPPTMVELEAREQGIYTRKQVKRTEFPIKDGVKPGHAYRLGKTAFQSIRDELITESGEVQVFGPFKDNAEWELAKWLIKNVGHAQADALLKLSIVSR